MYEVGDKVIYQGADKNAYKKVGILKSIEEKDGKPQLTVEFEGGETFTAPVDDWSREFTNAATNAKFKVGDKIWVKTIQKRGVVKGVSLTGNQYDIAYIDGKGGYHNEEELETLKAIGTNACTSTNSVVRNAIAANRRMARNATGAYKGWVSILDSYARFLGDIVSGGKGPKDSAEFKRLSEAADIIKKASAALSRY